MTDIVATDVVYSLEDESALEDNHLRNTVSMAFGDGSLTYPTGGVPLTKAKMGMARHIRSFKFVDEANSNGFVYKFDKSNEKIRIYQGDYSEGSDGPLIELAGGSATPAAATVIAEVEGY